MTDFAKFLQKNKDISHLQAEIEKMTFKKTFPKDNTSEDSRFWNLTPDKAGNSMAIIRFLPGAAADGDDALPWVKIVKHSFRGPEGWYIENSRETLGQNDPCNEMNIKFLGSKNPDLENFVKGKNGSRRKIRYYSNIFVIEDPAKPENNGKVFLYDYGEKLLEKINGKAFPKFQNEKPVIVSDFLEGANLKLIMVRKLAGDGETMPNYDQSEWSTPGPLSNDHAVLEKIWRTEYSLKEFTDPSKIKSYDELKARLDKVMIGFHGYSVTNDVPRQTTPQAQATQLFAAPQTSQPVPKIEIPVIPTPSAPAEDDDMAKALALFKNLAN